MLPLPVGDPWELQAVLTLLVCSTDTWANTLKTVSVNWWWCENLSSVDTPLVSRGVQGQENIVVFPKKSRAPNVHVICRVGCSPHAKRTAQTQLYIVLGLLLTFERPFCTWAVTSKIWCAFQLVNLFLYPLLLYQPKETSPQMTLINCSWYI